MKKILIPFVVSVAGFVAVQNPIAASATPTTKVTICHRTHSTTNPYVRITVSQNAVGNGTGKHGGNTHDQYSTILFPSGKPVPNVYNPAVSYNPPSEKKWGDIISPVDVLGAPLVNAAAAVAGLNYSGIGAAIFNGTGVHAGLCKAMSARAFYDLEVAAGQNPTDVLADMEEAESDEWAAARSACGGSFVGCSPSVIGSPAPVVSYRKLRGTLWLDANRNGLFNAGEKILANYPLVILPAPGNPSQTTYTAVTGSDGTYELSDLPSGNWIVRPAALPNANYDYVFDSDSGVAQVDWNVVINLPTVGEVTANFAAALTTAAIRAGVTDTLGSASVSQRVRGSIFIDANRDGSRGSTEKVLVNYPIEIVPGAGNPSSMTYSAVTDAAGNYVVSGLPAGNWVVRPAALSRLTYERVYDTDSGTTQVDWLAAVMVPAGGEAIADFGAALTAASVAAGVADDLGVTAAASGSVSGTSSGSTSGTSQGANGSPNLPVTGPVDLWVISALATVLVACGLALRRRRFAIH